MPCEDDYKMWLEKSLIEMNPDWVCDGMAGKEFTHDWCEKYCGKDSDYITPKCLHMYYHHIVRADRKTEPRGCDADCTEDCTECAKETELWKAEQTEPSLEQFRVGLEYHTDAMHFGKAKGESITTDKTENSSEKPNNCDTCKWGEWYRQGYDITMMSDECGGCCSWNNKWTPKTEPQTDCSWK